MIDYIKDLIANFFGKGKTTVPSNLSPKDLKAFKKNSACAAKEARKGFQPDQWGM